MDQVITVTLKPVGEPMLARLRREFLSALLAEAIVHEGSMQSVEALETPSQGFIAKREQAERVNGCTFVKFFTE